MIYNIATTKIPVNEVTRDQKAVFLGVSYGGML